MGIPENLFVYCCAFFKSDVAIPLSLENKITNCESYKMSKRYGYQFKTNQLNDLSNPFDKRIFDEKFCPLNKTLRFVIEFFIV